MINELYISEGRCMRMQIISWINQLIGETSSRSRIDFFCMEAIITRNSFKERVRRPQCIDNPRAIVLQIMHWFSWIFFRNGCFRDSSIWTSLFVFHSLGRTLVNPFLSPRGDFISLSGLPVFKLVQRRKLLSYREGSKLIKFKLSRYGLSYFVWILSNLISIF